MPRLHVAEPTVERLTARSGWVWPEVKRLAAAAWCRLRGHVWGPWYFDWPYDSPEYWDEESPRDPRPDEKLMWFRGCGRNCGAIEHASGTLLQRASLPGETAGLDGHPFRKYVMESE